MSIARFVVAFSFIGAVTCASTASAAPPTPTPHVPRAPREIVESSEAAQRLLDVTASATITTRDSSGETRVKSFTLWRRLDDDKVHYASLTRFVAPAEIRGEAILFEERSGDDNDVQLYLPRYKKVRRVEAGSQSSSFMGSALSYSDIAPPHVDDYQQTLLRTEPCPGDATAGEARSAIDCHVVEQTPKSESVAEHTGYSRNVQWIRVDNFMMVQTELYDRQSRLWKRLSASEIREVDPAQHKWYSHLLRVEDVLARRVTTLKLEQLKANTGLAPQLFTAQNLARE